MGTGVEPLSGGTRSITLKGSKVPTTLWRERERASRGLLLSAARGFPEAARQPGMSAAPTRVPSPACATGRIYRACRGSLAPPGAPDLPRHGHAPARTSRGARFSLSQQAGKACAQRRAQRGRPGRGASAETRASCDLLCEKGRGRAPAGCPGGRPCEFLRKTPLENTETFQKTWLCPSPRPAAFHPVGPLLSSRPGPHLRPC